MNGWRPTDTLVRVAVVAAVLPVVAVLAGRPDLVVLAAPFLVHAVAVLARTPQVIPHAAARLLHRSVREGEGTAVRVTLAHADEVEHAAVALVRPLFTRTRPSSGVVGAERSGRDDATLRLDVPVAALRWGRRSVGEGLVGATSAWAGYQWGPEELRAGTLLVLPLPSRFDSRAPTPHPVGLVGTHPARRGGTGTELGGIRPFAAGDRLRRLHWPVSLRTGTLHVTELLAEQDTAVLLVVDASVDVGHSGGLPGPVSSLDVAVRAAGAIAEHYLTAGDRVGLRVIGPDRQRVVHAGAGRRHLRRILDTLAGVVPAQRAGGAARLRLPVPPGTMVVILSPMLAEEAFAAAALVARRGLDVVVVDTLPDEVVLDDRAEGPGDALRLAWRLRRLERETALVELARTGVPVVAWRGPGTLDEVLRRLSRRPARPGGAAR